MLSGRRQPSGDQERSHLVAVQAGGVGFVVEARPADVGRRRPLEQAFLFGIAVEPGHRAQPAGDRGPSASAILEVASEALDVGSARPEQADVVLLAPNDELAQVQGVGIAGQPPVAGQARGQRALLEVGKHGIDDCNFGGSAWWSCGTSRSGRDPEARTTRPQIRLRAQRLHDL